MRYLGSCRVFDKPYEASECYCSQVAIANLALPVTREALIRAATRQTRLQVYALVWSLLPGRSAFRFRVSSAGADCSGLGPCGLDGMLLGTCSRQRYLHIKDFDCNLVFTQLFSYPGVSLKVAGGCLAWESKPQKLTAYSLP